MRDWKNLVTSYRFNENILSDVEKYALKAGFKDFTLRSVNTEWIFKEAHKLRGMYLIFFRFCIYKLVIFNSVFLFTFYF